MLTFNLLILAMMVLNCANAGDPAPPEKIDIWGDTPVIIATCTFPGGEIETKKRLLWGTYKSTDAYEKCTLVWERPEDE